MTSTLVKPLPAYRGDEIVATGGQDAKYRPHTEGQFVALCVDTIDLGDRVEDYPGKPKSISRKCALVFRTGDVNPDTRELIDVSREFTVSMNEKANLRRFLEQWRGKPYSPAQLEQGVPLHRLTGQYGLLTVAQKQSGKGNAYAVVSSCVQVPALMRDRLPEYPPYTRPEYWAERKAAYAAEAKLFRAESHVAPIDEPPFPGDSDNDLPF